MHQEQDAGMSVKKGNPPDSMADVSDVTPDEANDYGAVRIHNNVMAAITRLAALKVPGVVELCGSLVDGLADILGKKNANRGIGIDVTDSGVTIELQVTLEYGVRIPEVAWRLQNDVREAVEQMTGKNVQAVHVVVQDIRLPESRTRLTTEESKG